MLNHNSEQRTANSGQRTAIRSGLRRRAKAIINDRSIDVETRAIIRYGLETSDPWLAQLVRRIEAGQTIIETIVVLKHPIDPRKNIVGK